MAFTVKRFKDYIYNELNRESRTRHMNDRAIQFEDAEGRKIKISPDEGVQVEDSEGTIIHDTPNCVIATGMNYGGHIYWVDATTQINNIDITETATGSKYTMADGILYSSLTNVDITTELPTGLTNAKGALVSVYNRFSLPYDIVGENSYGVSEAYYCMAYNSSANSTYNYISSIYGHSQSASADLCSLRHRMHTQAVIPIVYNGTSPYITWWMKMVMRNLTSSTGSLITADGRMYLEGFLV